MELVLIGLRRALSGQIQCNWLVKSDANRWSSEVQFPIKRVVTGEGDDAMFTQGVLHHEVRIAHFHMSLRFSASSNDVSVIARKDDDRSLGQVGPEDSLAARIVAVDKTDSPVKLIHGGKH